MASLQEIKARVLAIRGKEIDLAIEAMNLSSEAAADLNASQLAQGMMKDGNLSKFKYAPFTIEAKSHESGLAAITDHLTNYDTGESYRKLYMKASGNQVAFGTKTDKEADISKRMKGKAFGLTGENKEELIRLHVQSKFNSLIRTKLKL